MSQVPEWIPKQVMPEVIAMVNRWGSDLKLSLDTACRHAPDANARKDRAQILDAFMNTMIDAVTSFVCSFGNSSEATEMGVQSIVKHRFEEHRKEKLKRELGVKDGKGLIVTN